MKECPRCKVELKERLPGGIRYDECVRCNGIYYDQDELRQAKDLAQPDSRWLDFDIIKAVGNAQNESKTKLLCPSCSGVMVEVKYQDTGVVIDVCSQCHGVWLDEGEFGKIIQSLNEQVNSMSVGDYIPAALNQGIEIFVGAESRYSDWKDFTMVLYLMSLRAYVEIRN